VCKSGVNVLSEWFARSILFFENDFWKQKSVLLTVFILFSGCGLKHEMFELTEEL
jgi:hypothetical protein